MKFLYHKVIDDGSVSFTFKVETSPHRQLPMGKIYRSDNPDPFFSYVLAEGYDIEMKIEARAGLTEISMVRKSSRSGEQSAKQEELPAVSRSSHQS